jgi:tetratricopeptide (TPR) repeat protein
LLVRLELASTHNLASHNCVLICAVNSADARIDLQALVGDTIMRMRFWLIFILVTFVALSILGSSCRAHAQQDESGKPAEKAESDRRADRNAEAQESSSRDTKIDISPPKDDAKTHPNSASAMEEVEGKPPTDDVQEFHPWNPLKALKDVEVGDFYFKRKNYRAALDRYKEALYYKQDDAVATFRAAQCQEKLGSVAEALANYEAYLRILPDGPFAADAGKSIERLNGSPGASPAKKN